MGFRFEMFFVFCMLFRTQMLLMWRMEMMVLPLKMLLMWVVKVMMVSGNGRMMLMVMMIIMGMHYTIDRIIWY